MSILGKKIIAKSFLFRKRSSLIAILRCFRANKGFRHIDLCKYTVLSSAHSFLAKTKGDIES